MKTTQNIMPGTLKTHGWGVNFRILIGMFALGFALTGFTSLAHAQQVVLPRKGMQYFTVGLSLDPGFLYDSNAPARSDAAPGTRAASTYALSAAGMAHLGLTQIITPNFFMSGEFAAGPQWTREHTATLEGIAPSATRFAWQAGLYGHWLPFGDLAGWAGSLGVQLFRVHLKDAPLQVLGADLKLGKYIWTANEQFLLLQVGYTLPIIQGLSRPTDFDHSADSDKFADETWSFHRFSVGFQYGF